MKTVSPVTSIFFFFNGCNSLIYNLKKVQVFSGKNIRKTLEKYTEESEKFSHSFGQNYGKTF